jgi:hypothetical protein
MDALHLCKVLHSPVTKLSGKGDVLFPDKIWLTLFKFGDLKGGLYTFNRNAILPMHRHDESTNHISIVLSGSFLCTGDFDQFVMEAGEVYDWPQSEIDHQFEALEQDSRLINIIRRYSS